MSLEPADKGAVCGTLRVRLDNDGEVTIESSGTFRRTLNCCCSRSPLEVDPAEPVDEEGGDSAGEPEPLDPDPAASSRRMGDKEGTGTRWMEPCRERP